MHWCEHDTAMVLAALPLLAYARLQLSALRGRLVKWISPK